MAGWIANVLAPAQENLPAPSAAQPELLRPPAENDDLLLPDVLRSAEPDPLLLEEPLDHFAPDPLLQYAGEAPLGFTGMSSVMPTAVQEDSHFVPIEDRWRLGFSEWDRYGEGHPLGDDYPCVEGAVWDPYNQNVLKGDYPIIGQHTFFRVTAESLAITEFRQVPTPTTPFESTADPFQEEFFGDPDQFFRTQNFILSLELFHGDAAFKQP
ncbi:MAG: hypothetical protein KY475_01355, partial [Planctomycetes bacterium]|nr:hypothetical protein [Planctomycetota bacterium]